MKFGYLQVTQERIVVPVSVAEESSSSTKIMKIATRRLTELICVDSASTWAVSNRARVNLL